MSENDYKAYMKRAGLSLFALAVCDVALYVYCMLAGRMYFPVLGSLALILGLLLHRGSLSTAYNLGHFLALYLSGVAVATAAMAFIYPIGLLNAQANGDLARVVINVGATVLEHCLLVICAYWLLRPRVLEARTRSGKKTKPWRLSAAIGVVLASGLIWMVGNLNNGPVGQRAKEEARRLLGQQYSFYVKSVQTSYSSGQKSIEVVVAAWKDDEVRYVPIKWNE